MGADVLPQPLARMRAELADAKGDLRAEHALAFAVLEVGVRWLAVCLLQSRAALQAPLDEAKRVELFFRRPSFGSWVEVLLRHGKHKIAGVSGAHAVLGVINNLLEMESPAAGRLHQGIRSGKRPGDGTKTQPWSALIELLPSYRNDFIGHAGFLAEDHYECYSPLLFEAATDFLDTLAEHPFIVRVAHPRMGDTSDEAIEIRDCSGVEVDVVTTRAEPLPGSRIDVPYIADPTTGAPLLSLGSMLYHDAGVLQIFDRSPPRGGIDYMDFATGERQRVRGKSIADSELVHALSYQEDDQRAIAGRVRIEYQALRRAARRGDRIPFRVAITSQAPTDLRCHIALDPDDAWRHHTDSVDVPVARGDCGTAIVWCEPLSAGVLEAPRLLIAAEFGSGTTQLLQVERPVVRVETAPALPIVGMDDALSKLCAPLFGGSNPAVVAVVGTGGSGKSSVLDEVARKARSTQVRELRARATRDTGQELKPFNDLLRDLLGIVEAEHDAASLRAFASERLAQYLGDETPVVDYFVDHLLGVDPAQFDAGVREYRWFRLLAVAAAETPLLLVIDDLDQADDTTLQLLRGLLARWRQDGVRIELALSASEESTSELLKDLVSEGKLCKASVHLEGLNPADVAELIDHLYPQTTYRDDMPWLSDALHERSAGNPTFALSLARQLGGSGDSALFTQQEDGSWSLGQVLSRESLLAALPLQLTDSLGQRIDALPEAASAVLEFAGLLGQEVPVSVLERVIEDADTLDDGLDRLEVEHVIEAVDPALTRYRFVSSQVPDLVAERVRGKGRRALRRRYNELAEALTSELGGKPQHAKQLGSVLHSAGRPNEAFPYLLQALHTRIGQGHYAAGMSVLDQLREVRSNCTELEPEQEIAYHSHTGLLLGNFGAAKIDEASAAMKEAARLAQAAGAREAQGNCLVKLSEFAIRRAQEDEAQKQLDALFELLADSDFPETRYRGNNNLAVLRKHQGRHQEALEIMKGMLGTAPDKTNDAILHNNLGNVSFLLRDYEGAVGYFQRGLEIAKEIDNPTQAMVIRIGISNTRFMSGEFKSARDDYREALELYRQRQNRGGLANCYGNLGLAEAQLGRLDVAMSATERAIEISEEIDFAPLIGRNEINRALIRSSLGDLDGAATSLTRAAQIAAEMSDADMQERIALYQQLFALWSGEFPNPSLDKPVAATEHADELAYLQLAVQLARATTAGHPIPEATRLNAEELLGIESPCPYFDEYCRLASAYVSAIAPIESCPQVLRNWADGLIDFPDGAPQELIYASLSKSIRSLNPDAADAYAEAGLRVVERRASSIEDGSFRQKFKDARASLFDQPPADADT